MKLAIAGALALALPQSAVAKNSIDWAPERFRGNNVAVVIFTDRAGLDELCGVAPPPGVILACKRQLTNGTPVLILPNPNTYVGPVHYQQLVGHELGHVNGWSGEHEE